MDIRKLNAAYKEIVDLERDLREAQFNLAAARIRLEGEPLSYADWDSTSRMLIQSNAKVNRITQRIKILKGRVHFEASTL
jgi:hypothetical protein